MMRTFSKAAVLLAGASVFAAGVASAEAQTAASAGQTVPATQPVPPDQQTTSNADPVADTTVARNPDAASHNDQNGEVVVTGSRTIRNGNASPSPVTVVSTQDVLRAQPGGTLADALNVLPVFAGSRGPSSNPSTTGTAAAGNGGANQLNLRNLGANRTLVLLDGYRVPPTTANGIVDVDIIPQLLVQRVDIVTGGVSAVYGSDAVSGVVNYVLDKKFTGVSLTGSSGVSQRGDAQRTDFGIAAGTGLFGGRGHIEGSYEFIGEDGIDRRSDRAYLNNVGVAGSVPGSTAAAGTAANPYQLYTNLRQAGSPFGGLITSGALTGQTFNDNGTLRSFVNGTATGTSGLQVGGDGGYYDSSLIAPLRAHQVFGRASFDLSDSITAYVQVSGDLKVNESYADTVQLSNYTFSSANAYLLPGYQSVLAAAKQSTFKLSELVADLPRLDARAVSNQWLYSGGLDGKLGAFRWGANFTHGVAILNTTLEDNPNYQRLTAALDAVTNPATGQVVCNVTLTNPTANPGCVPINVFGANSVSPAAAAYVLQATHYRTVTKLDDVSAHIEGSAFNLPAGPVNVALSGEYRKVSFHSNSDALPTDLANCTGIRYNCTATTGLWGFTFAASPLVSQEVKEGSVEFDAPLLKDIPLIRALSVNGAARYTSYNTSGNYWTWKLGFDWHLTDTLRLRGTRSRDIRAPTLYELFAPTGSVPVRPTDILTGLSPTVYQYDLSNPDLKAEVANTLTGGIVWTPTRKISIALDYYHIKLTDAVVQITGSATNIQNACYASGGTSPFCALQSRPGGYSLTAANMAASNVVTAWYTKYYNIGEIRTYGADLEANYSTSLFGRPASLRLLGDYQPHVYYVQPGTTTIDQGDVAFGPLGLGAGPSVRLSGFARFQPAPHVTFDVFERWRNPMKLGGDPTQYWVSNHIAAFATTNITLTTDFASRMGRGQFYVSVTNLFDADPPVGAYSGNGTRAGLRDGFALGDDPTGRLFLAGVRLKL